jgi:hypothetical protein
MMGVAATSRIAYRELLESGAYKRKLDQWWILLAVWEDMLRSPPTGGELSAWAIRAGLIQAPRGTNTNTHASLNPLEKMGCVRRLPKRECTETHAQAVTWETTGVAPFGMPAPHSKSRTQELEEEIEMLAALVRDLEDENAFLRAKLEGGEP